MILDHIAYRVQNRDKTAEFLHKTLKYNTETEFEIVFDNNATADCLVLTPPTNDNPELFVSDGTEDSIVSNWVRSRGGVGGIHHMAYQVTDIGEVVSLWRSSGIKFLSQEIIDCPEDNLRKIFTKPLDVMGGIIFELIERGEKGF